ncbi:MAG: hypothetical protein IT456_15270 [Planctomycetes bacterium]|jgi:hypothetical protein|nr:hypothetical protein [Planctomycetota bacterium]
MRLRGERMRRHTWLGCLVATTLVATFLLTRTILEGPPGAHRSVLATPFCVTGRVVNPEGKPCAAALVVADVWVNRSEWPDSRGNRDLTAKEPDFVFRPSADCDEDGRFVLYLPSAGTFSVRAEPSEYQPSPSLSIAVEGPQQAGQTGQPAELLLQSGPAWHWIQGLITDPAGRPLPDWDVYGHRLNPSVRVDSLEALVASSTSHWEGPSFAMTADTLTVRTDQAGRFRLPVADYGEFRLYAHRNRVVVNGPLASASGAAVTWQIDYWQQRGSVVNAVAKDAETGVLLDDIDFTLVTKLDGRTTWHRQGEPDSIRCWDRLTPGQQTSIIAAPHGELAASRLAPAATEFFLTGREPISLVVQLRPWALQRVVVHDAKDQPVVGRTVTATNPRGTLQSEWFPKGTTDLRGMVTLRVPPGPVRYQVLAAQGNGRVVTYEGPSIDVVTIPGENSPVTLRIP